MNRRLRQLTWTIVIIWIMSFPICVIYVFSPKFAANLNSKLVWTEKDNGVNLKLIEFTKEILTEIKDLQKNNLEMKKIILGIKSWDGNWEEGNFNSTTESEFQVKEMSNFNIGEYEKLRRFLEMDLKDFWRQIQRLSGRLEEPDLNLMRDLYRQLRNNLNLIRRADGFESYREKETNELSAIIQSRIFSLQNPVDCDTARKSLCLLVRKCGFGCQIHALCLCLIAAYSNGHTLLLESSHFNYNKGGWEQTFLPLSDSCPDDLENDTRFFDLMQLDPVKQFLPLIIPSDIGDRIEKVHGEPHVWWVGQFMKFLLRLQPHMKRTIDGHIRKLGVRSPTVGIHIRRTDKQSEAKFHKLDEYMVHVEEYFEILKISKKNVQKRVFIASDDPTVIQEARISYPEPDWIIMGDPEVALTASVSQRYSKQGLEGIIKDIFVLAECDFIVCTFSSQICRLAYSLMQSKHADASQRFVSLDDIYFFASGNNLDQIVHQNHQPRNSSEIEILVGDQIGLEGNHWDGFSKGINRRTGKVGLFPSFKARTIQKKLDFPVKKWWTLENQ